MPPVHPAWAQATSLADLGQLTADWLEGRLGGECPGYLDTETEDETRHLIPVLAATNRRGFVTTNSQPGIESPRTRQRAAVDGYITDQALLRSIKTEARRAGITVIAEKPGDSTRGIVVTQEKRRLGGWKDFTWFGAFCSRRDRVEVDWHKTGAGAAREAEAAVCLTLIDEAWGRDDRLWAALATAVSR